MTRDVSVIAAARCTLVVAAVIACGGAMQAVYSREAIDACALLLVGVASFLAGIGGAALAWGEGVAR